MQDDFPAAADLFNVLYLVSSAMPPGAVTLARAARERGATLVWNQNGVAYRAWQRAAWREVNEPLAALMHEADHVFFQSDFCRRASERFLGPRRGPSEVLHNPVDTTVFTPASRDADPDTLTLLLAGNQDQWYRFEAAVLTLRRVRDRGRVARLLITGRLGWAAAPAEARVRADALVAELGLADAVEFVGAYAQSEAPAIFRRAHVLLHTKYQDPCPGVVLEALACGVPVVYSATGGVPELVGADAGIGVPAEEGWERIIAPDPDALASGVLTVSADLGRWGSAARTRAVERFDLRPWLDRHRAVFEALLT